MVFLKHLRNRLECLRLLVECIRKREKTKRDLLAVQEQFLKLYLQPFNVLLRRMMDELAEKDLMNIFSEPVNLDEVCFKFYSHTSPFFHFYILSTLNHSLYKLYLLNFTHFNYFLISFCSFFQSLSKVLNLNIINSTILHQLSISQVSLRYSPHLLRPIRLKIMRPSLNIPWTFKPCAPTLL